MSEEQRGCYGTKDYRQDHVKIIRRATNSKPSKQEKCLHTSSLVPTIFLIKSHYLPFILYYSFLTIFRQQCNYRQISKICGKEINLILKVGLFLIIQDKNVISCFTSTHFLFGNHLYIRELNSGKETLRQCLYCWVVRRFLTDLA